jgi:hypothetical protein
LIDLVIAGLGNIGLPFVDFVSRMPGMRSVVLVDPDVFTENNVSCQMVALRDVDCPKVEVAAARIAEANPALRIETLRCRLEHAPRGLYRGRVIASCLDSRFARASLSDIAWTVGAPLWLDAGVRPEGRLARASAAFPSHAKAAGICCGWSPQDWSLAAREYSCAGAFEGAPSRSPAFVGAMAASVMAHLLDRFIANDLPPSADARSWVFSLDAHRSWTTSIRRSSDCRCKHQSWAIEPLGHSAETCKLSDLTEAGLLAVPGMPVTTALRCDCGSVRGSFRIAARLPETLVHCDSCGGKMSSGALDLFDEIDLSALEDFGPEVSALALADLGVSNGDIIRLGARHFEVGASVLFQEGRA